MNESDFKPNPRNPLTRGPAIFDTPEQALDELLRRISVLGQARYAYEGLAIRMAADAAVELQDMALNNQFFRNHRTYAPAIDVFETSEGLHVSVDEAQETAALGAEIGTTRFPQQPLWNPRGRAEIRKTGIFGQSLAALVAAKAGVGKGLSDSDVESVHPSTVPTSQPGLDSLRKILKDRQALMAKEEA